MNAGERKMWDSMGVRYSPNQQREIAEFKAKLPTMTEDELRKAADQYIWLSAYANNNPRSAYHPMCDATHDECKRRGRVDIYKDAHATLVRQAGR